MEIHITNQQDDGEFGFAKNVIIKTFRQVSIFGEDYTKIVYMHSENDFTIEKIGDNIDPDENVQVISGPKASEIITTMIEREKQKGSTFVWSGARFENAVDTTLLKEYEPNRSWDPLKRDFVESEVERRRYKRRKEDRENENNK